MVSMAERLTTLKVRSAVVRVDSWAHSSVPRPPFLPPEFTEDESKGGEVDVTPEVMAACSGDVAGGGASSKPPWLLVKEELAEGMSSLHIIAPSPPAPPAPLCAPRVDGLSLRTIDSAHRLLDGAVTTPRTGRRLVSVASRAAMRAVPEEEEVTEAAHVPAVPTLPVVMPEATASVYYPANFPRAFHDALRALDASDAAAVDALRAQFSRRVTVLLVRVFLPASELLLDHAEAHRSAHALVRAEAAAGGGTIHEDSTVVILSAPPDGVAGVALAVAIGASLHSRGYPANVGVCAGEVLAFSGAGGGQGTIAGSPINVASKLAEDTEERGRLFFDESVAPQARLQCGDDAVPFEVVKSGVTITGVRVEAASASARKGRWEALGLGCQCVCQ